MWRARGGELFWTPNFEMDAESCRDVADIALLLLLKRRHRLKPNGRIWVHKILQEKEEKGEFNLVRRLQGVCNSDRFQSYFRLTQEQFGSLLSIVGPMISKQTTQMRKPICAEERLSICLKYLATGDSFRSIAFSYRVGESSVRKIVL